MDTSPMPDREFARELRSLIDSAEASAASVAASRSSLTNSSPPATQNAVGLRKHRLECPISARPVKKVRSREKNEPPVQHLQIHPSRLRLLGHLVPDFPDSSSTIGSDMPHYESRNPGRTEINSDGRTPTLRKAVQRQFDSGNDDFSYEELTWRRRREKLVHVDRYVPPAGKSSVQPRRKPTAFRFKDLPTPVKGKILALLLVKDRPIEIDFTWLRPFLNGHCRIPNLTQTITTEDGTYQFPVPWAKLLSNIGTMQKDCSKFEHSLMLRGDKTRRHRAPCKGLTTALLRVSKGIHQQAASVFYGENTFSFPWATAAWMQLESFLETIGSTNVGSLRGIRIHVPLWTRGVHLDYLEGALLDLTAPASRLSVTKPPPTDRLLSAVRRSATLLTKAGNLTSLTLDLENGITADRWCGRYDNGKQLISLADAEHHVTRKQEGIELLRKMNKSLDLTAKPQIAVYHGGSRPSRPDVKDFRERAARIIKEATLYGYTVNQYLQARGRW